MRKQHIIGMEGPLRTFSKSNLCRGRKSRPSGTEEPPSTAAHRNSAGLSIEGAGLVARNIKLYVFLVDPFIAVHAILLRIVIHGVVPPVEQGIGLGLADRIPVVAAGIFPDQPARHVIGLAVPVQRVERKKESSFVIVVLVDSCRKVRLAWEKILRPSTGHREQEQKRNYEDGRRRLRRCHNRLTINGVGRQANSTMAYQGLQARAKCNVKNSRDILAPIAKISL